MAAPLPQKRVRVVLVNEHGYPGMTQPAALLDKLMGAMTSDEQQSQVMGAFLGALQLLTDKHKLELLADKQQATSRLTSG